MDQALLLSAVLMGLAGTPHCLAMCGAACGAAAGGRARELLPFHLGRLAAYSMAGAVAAASVGSLAALGQAVASLRPLWTLVHMAALGLGLYLVWQGRQPAWMERLGRVRAAAVVEHRPGEHWQALAGPARSAGFGLAWVAWPCGLLQSALVVAALANTAWGGAAAMAGFAAVSAAGLGLAPWAFARLAGGGGAALQAHAWAVRLAGAMLAGASAWALGQDLLRRVIAYCLA